MSVCNVAKEDTIIKFKFSSYINFNLTQFVTSNSKLGNPNSFIFNMSWKNKAHFPVYRNYFQPYNIYVRLSAVNYIIYLESEEML